MELENWQYGNICYRPDLFSYFVSIGQAVPEYIVWGLTGISLYRRDLTFTFVIWIAYCFGFGAAYGISHLTQIRRPENYFCADYLAYPDRFFVATMTTLLTFAYAALVTRLKIYLSTLLWFGVATVFYMFATVWNYQMTIEQMFFSLAVSFILSTIVGVVYTMFIHPFKVIFMRSRIARWLGFENSL